MALGKNQKGAEPYGNESVWSAPGFSDLGLSLSWRIGQIAMNLGPPRDEIEQRKWTEDNGTMESNTSSAIFHTAS